MSLPELRKAARNGSEQHVAASNLAEDVCDEIAAGRRVSVARISVAVQEFVDLISLDHDLAPLIVAMQNAPDEYLFDHCINVALLSMSTAAQIGWNRERIAELGIGAFLHDVGMLKVPSSIRLAPRPLTDDERQLVRRHPFHTLDYLEDIKGAPQAATFIAYQVHERLDGSGYPNRRSGASLHPYARIVSIADTYAAMTHRRPYRSAHAPYDAIKTILFGASVNRYDRAFVRAFLDSIALFPIGSLVDLSDGSTGQVVRANPGLHARPVVEILDGGMQTTGLTVDLSAQPDVKVVGALSQAARQALPQGP